MINDNTILSSFNDRPTLLEWLNKVEEALKSDTATAFHVNNRGNATLTFSIDFADGNSIESEPIVLQQGESVIGAEIRSGHLILTLTNGDELDAGDVKPVNSFLINASQHLIVNFDDGTNQDLGAIFSGNVNIDGNFTANSIIENMPNGYNIQPYESNKGTITPIYASICKNGNKLTIVYTFKFIKHAGQIETTYVSTISVPESIGEKLVPYSAGYVDTRFTTASLLTGVSGAKSVVSFVYKWTNRVLNSGIEIDNLEDEKEYFIRQEITFLLSTNYII